MTITNGLRTAIEYQELSLRFQPIVSANSSHIVGAELLLRWKPPTGEISPAVFIPIAEMTGSIMAIGTWVFRQACRVEAEWRQRWGAQAPYVSVNLSARQLNQETLTADFTAILAETGANPANLLLEITETSLMADVETNLRVLRRLADLGLRVAVDDFGTGYSSLAQLTRLPVDVLKIDRAFVDGIDKSQENRAVIRAIIGLGRALDLKLVAEGVENGTQLRELRVLGCHFIQGYYFYRPLEENTFVETFEQASQQGSLNANDPLHFVIYVSQAVEPLSAKTLSLLQQQSRRANRLAGITGCLIYQDGYFMQMIEGTEEAIASLLDKIKKDVRHCNFRIVIEGPTQHRVFADWGLELRDLTPRCGSHNTSEGPNFSAWQHRTISLYELGEDARTSYAFITGTVQN